MQNVKNVSILPLLATVNKQLMQFCIGPLCLLKATFEGFHLPLSESLLGFSNCLHIMYMPLINFSCRSSCAWLTCTCKIHKYSIKACSKVQWPRDLNWNIAQTCCNNLISWSLLFYSYLTEPITWPLSQQRISLTINTRASDSIITEPFGPDSIDPSFSLQSFTITTIWRLREKVTSYHYGTKRSEDRHLFSVNFIIKNFKILVAV